MRRKKVTPWSLGCQPPFKESPRRAWNSMKALKAYQTSDFHISFRRIFCDFFLLFFYPSAKMVPALQDAEGV